MLQDLGYYITATKITEDDDLLVYVWTGQGFELADHVPYWPVWKTESEAREQFFNACSDANALNADTCGLYCMDDAGDHVINEVDFFEEAP